VRVRDDDDDRARDEDRIERVESIIVIHQLILIVNRSRSDDARDGR